MQKKLHQYKKKCYWYLFYVKQSVIDCANLTPRYPQTDHLSYHRHSFGIPEGPFCISLAIIMTLNKFSFKLPDDKR